MHFAEKKQSARRRWQDYKADHDKEWRQIDKDKERMRNRGMLMGWVAEQKINIKRTKIRATIGWAGIVPGFG